MSDGDHIEDRVTGLAALAPGDPERERALLHVRSCESCARAWEEAEALLVLLAELPPPPSPSTEVLARTSRAIVSELEPSLLRVLWGAPVCVALVGMLLTAIAKHRAQDHGTWLEAGMVLTAAIVCATAAAKFPRIAWVTSIAISALLVGITARAGGLAPLLGLKCILTELVAAAMPYAAIAYTTIKRREPVSAASYMTVAAAGALAGQAALHLTCVMRDVAPHLIVFHMGGVLLASALGMLGTGRILRAAIR